MRGNRNSDFTAADREMRNKLSDPNWRRPPGTTWHHHENGTTMQLLPESVHATGRGASTPHSGGAAMYGNGGHAAEF